MHMLGERGPRICRNTHIKSLCFVGWAEIFFQHRDGHTMRPQVVSTQLQVHPKLGEHNGFLEWGSGGAERNPFAWSIFLDVLYSKQ